MACCRSLYSPAVFHCNQNRQLFFNLKFDLIKIKYGQQSVGVEVVFAFSEKTQKSSVTNSNFRLKRFKHYGPNSAATS